MELIIVMVVAGILAAVMIPRLERDSLREAANQVVRHIQYAQHLAMMNDVYDANVPAWRQNRWMIDLCDEKYAVQRVNGTDTAIDPLTQLDMNGTVNTAYDLSTLGVTSIASAPTTNCSVIFDNLGRPYATVAGVPSTADTIITLKPNATSTRSAVITITKETGYVTLTSLN